jgi:hypothetical protein
MLLKNPASAVQQVARSLASHVDPAHAVDVVRLSACEKTVHVEVKESEVKESERRDELMEKGSL